MIEYKYITERKDRVSYIYYMLEEAKTRAFIQKFIEQLGITSRSTAERIIKNLDMNKKLFLATYTPTKNDREAVEDVLGIKKEPVSDTFEEIAAKNDETQKEIYDKAEEIKLLKLELHKYRVLYDRQKLECLLLDGANSIELNPKYDSLYKVLLAAYNQAENGKGKERHQLNNEEPFEDQKICEIARRLSVDYNLGQAVKKIYESKRLADGRDIAELYGAINYIAAAIIVKQEEKNE